MLRNPDVWPATAVLSNNIEHVYEVRLLRG
jgi:hypothetical protein